MKAANVFCLILAMSVSCSLFGCSGSDGNNTTTIQMGGAIQGKTLSLSNSVSTLAGTSLSVDGTGTAARLNAPVGVVTDGTNLYIADSSNNTIRKTVIATGVTTTFAGSPGSSGSVDGIGAAARFANPRGIATDGTYLFVTDWTAIRKIVISTREVTTLAGSSGNSGAADGIGAAAKFWGPEGITTDGTNLYVADAQNNTIRKVVISTSAVTTLAGFANSSGSDDGIGASARFNFPMGITTDGTNLFVADYLNHIIRKIVIATGSVTTFAGAATTPGWDDGDVTTARFWNPEGITFDGTNIYIADWSTNTIRKIVIATGIVSTIAGTAGISGSIDGTGAAARFNYPRGITTDGANLYVADSGNNTIRKIDPSSTSVTTLVGTTAESFGATDGIGTGAKFWGPEGITTDGKNLYVADTRNSVIRKIVISTGVVTTLAGTAGVSWPPVDGVGIAAAFNEPKGITTDGTNLYVADSGNNTIRKIVISTGVVTTLVGTAGTHGSADGVGSAASFEGPEGITTDGTNLFVTDRYNCTIRKISIATGEVTTLAGIAGPAGASDGIGSTARFYLPSSITTDKANLYVTDQGNNTIRKIVIATKVVSTIAGTAGVQGSVDGIGKAAKFHNPQGITTDGTNLYVSEGNSNNLIRKIIIATGEVSTLVGNTDGYGSADGIGSVAHFFNPDGITTDGFNLYVADSTNNTIRKIN